MVQAQSEIKKKLSKKPKLKKEKRQKYNALLQEKDE